MMRKKSIFSNLNYLSTEQRAVIVTSVLTIIFCFLPWYAISSRVVSKWWNGFENVGSVGGYLITLFSLSALLLTILPTLGVKLKLPWKNEQVIVVLGVQSFFLSLVFLAVYIQYSLYDSLDSSTSFGIYLTVAGTLAMALSSLALAKSQIRSPYSVQNDFIRVPRQHQNINTQRSPIESDELTDAEVDDLLKGKEELASAPRQTRVNFEGMDNQNENPQQKNSSSFNF